MTDNTETSASKSPSHVAYQVRDRNGKGYWTRIGSAWQHADKSGFRRAGITSTNLMIISTTNGG